MQIFGTVLFLENENMLQYYIKIRAPIHEQTLHSKKIKFACRDIINFHYTSELAALNIHYSPT